jgi:hypothetical protein
MGSRSNIPLHTGHFEIQLSSVDKHETHQQQDSQNKNEVLVILFPFS